MKDRARNTNEFSKDKLKSAVVRAADIVRSKSERETDEDMGELMSTTEKVTNAFRQ